MREINIAQTLAAKRKEKGLTQDELAVYLGITKAAISKWETGQTYPDITLLPVLAAYFNISIDNLIGYQPQMVKSDIKKLYHRLSQEFAVKPFDEVIDECGKIIRKYYACPELLIQIGVLLMNHHMLAEKQEEQIEIMKNIRELFRHTKEISDDTFLKKEVDYLDAYCALLQNKPLEVLDTLSEYLKPSFVAEALLSKAYEMLGKTEKQIETLQTAVYQRILDILDMQATLVKAYEEEPDKMDMWMESFFKMTEIYQIERLHPVGICPYYLMFAQVLTAKNRYEEALDMVWGYIRLVTEEKFPLKLHGNKFFDQIDGWLEDLELGRDMPRSEAVVKASMIEAVEKNSELNPLKEYPRFGNMMNHLKERL